MPDWNPALASRLARLTLRPAREREIIDELSQHLDDRYQELRAGGATHDDAMRMALAEIDDEIGSDDLLAREMRSLRQASPPAPIAPGGPARGLAGDAWQDLVYAARMLRRNPGFAAAAILTLALGIGANTAIFSLVDAVLLRALPVADPEDLVLVSTTNARGDGRSNFSYPQFAYLREHAGPVAKVFAYAPMDLNLSAGNLTDAPAGVLVSDNYFSVLGVRPAIGRGFVAADEAVAVLSHRFWQARFGGDPTVVGRSVLVNGLPLTVVGVAPRRFFGVEIGKAPDVFLPLAGSDRLRPGPPRLPMQNGFWLNVMARVPPDVAAPQAVERVNIAYQQAIGEAGAAIRPNLARFLRERRVVLSPGAKGRRGIGEEFRTPLLILMTVVCLLLLIACANVANLLLARAAARRREIAIRLALGAGRGRLLRQFLTESLVLSAAGGAVGLLFAVWGSRALTVFFPNRVVDTALDIRVLGFTLVTSVLSGLLFGVAPALRSSRTDVAETFRGASLQDGHLSRWRLGKFLVAGQVGMALVLLIGAGLFIRTLGNLRAMDPGFRGNDVLLATLNPGLSRYTPERTTAFYSDLVQRAAALPGVRSATLADSPLLGGQFIDGFSVEGSSQAAEASIKVVGPRFFDTMGIAILRGRDFSPDDRPESTKVAIVNDTIARKYFDGADPIGRRIEVAGDKNVEIVGIIADTKYRALRAPVPNTVYLVMDQSKWAGGERTLHVRTAGDPAALATAIRAQVQALDKHLPVKMGLFSDVADENLAQERLVATLSGFFGGVALLLTAVGLYGVLAFTTARRTREIGIRMSLGARRATVLWMVLRDCLVLVVIGVVAGLIATLWLSRLVTRQLFEVAPADPATLVLATLFLITVAALAAYLPARRASRVDPMVALRYE
jgi:putative ABC transport system permease protein